MANVYKNILAERTKEKEKAKAPTPQSKPIPGREKDMAQNSAGGYTFAVDMWTQLDRFLVLGSEGGSYYASERKLTNANAKGLLTAINADGLRVVARIVEISKAARAPKNDPALFALALAMTHGDAATKKAAAAAIPSVARIGTHILHLAEYVNGMRGWGRGIRTGFAAWYNTKTPMQLAMQMTKYANRDGWTHADILALAHVKPVTSTHDALFSEAKGVAKNVEIDLDVAEFMSAADELKATRDAKTAVKLISDFRLPREMVPTELLNDPAIWDALLPHMGMEAMVRNLATMTRAKFLAPLSSGVKDILEKMANVEAVQKSRLHPIKVLAALLTYQAGHSVRGTSTWTPLAPIVKALNDLFYATFQNVVPTGKRSLLALDVSGSMWGGEVAGVPGLHPALASAALALLTMRTETMYETVGFTSGTGGRGWVNTASRARVDSVDGISRLPLNAGMDLPSVLKAVQNLPFGGTDCSLPMRWALKNSVPVDAFYVYTDSETWAGPEQPVQSLRRYRDKMGIPAKLVVVGLVANNFTIADPSDSGMMDFVGFDTAAPSLMADFVRGEF